MYGGVHIDGFMQPVKGKRWWGRDRSGRIASASRVLGRKIKGRGDAGRDDGENCNDDDEDGHENSDASNGDNYNANDAVKGGNLLREIAGSGDDDGAVRSGDRDEVENDHESSKDRSREFQEAHSNSESKDDAISSDGEEVHEIEIERGRGRQMSVEL